MRFLVTLVFGALLSVGLAAGCSDNDDECCDHEEHEAHYEDDADIKVDAPYARVRVNIPDDDDDEEDVDVDVDVDD
jgi:hypothetical protein